MMINRRGFIANGISATALVATGSTGWTQSRGPIKIGAFGPISGNAAAQGASVRELVEMAANLKNAAGGLLGRPIEMVIGDDAGKPEEAAVVARRFATRDQVVLAIGSVSSPASLAAAQVFREEEVPQIVVSGTAQRITTQGNEWVFRSAVPDRKLVSDLADFINEKMPKLKRFGFLYVNDDFGKGGFDAFGEAGKKHGMSITTEERYSRGDLDFTGQLTRLRASNPDALVEWSRYTEGVLIHRQIRQMGWDIPRFGSDGIGAPAFLELAKEAANGVIYPTPLARRLRPSCRPRRISSRWCASLNKPPDFVHAQAFDAFNIAVAAIERAKSVDRTAVRNALRQTDHQSVRGPFKFDQKGDPTLVTSIERIVDIRKPTPAAEGESGGNRNRQVGRTTPARQLQRGVRGGRPGVRRQPARQQLQARRSGGSAQEDSFQHCGSDIELQTIYVLENLKKTFEAAGSSLDHVVKARCSSQHPRAIFRLPYRHLPERIRAPSCFSRGGQTRSGSPPRPEPE